MQYLDSGTEGLYAALFGLQVGIYWQVDFNQECYVGQHGVLSYVVGIPGLILFAAGERWGGGGGGSHPVRGRGRVAIPVGGG